MLRCFIQHMEVKDQCEKEIKKAKMLQHKTRKKFDPLYKQFEAMMGSLVKMNGASIMLVKTARIFLAAAGKLVQTITEKVQAQLQKIAKLNEKGGQIRNQAQQKANELKDKAAGAVGDAKEAANKAMPKLLAVADHFDGLKKMLTMLEEAMDKMEEVSDDVKDAANEAKGHMSAKMMMAGDAMSKSNKSTSEAAGLANQLNSMQGAGLNQMMSSAVAGHLCRGNLSISKAQMVKSGDGLVGDDLVSFFMSLASKNGPSTPRTPRSHADEDTLSAADMEACMASADLPMLNVAGIMILMKNVVEGSADKLPEWATEACSVITTMLDPLVERITSFGLCMLMLDLREKNPEMHDEEYLDGMEDISGKMEMLKGFAEEFKLAIENQELPDAAAIFELAVQDCGSLCGGASLCKKLALLRAIVAVGSIDKDIFKLQESRKDLADLRSTIESLKSSDAFPGSIKQQMGQYADSEAYFFWVHSFGQFTTKVRWSQFRREFTQHYQNQVDRGHLSSLLNKLRHALFKGDETGKDVVYLESLCKLAARDLKQRPGGKHGTAPWYDVAAVAQRSGISRSGPKRSNRLPAAPPGRFSPLQSPILSGSPSSMLENLRHGPPMAYRTESAPSDAINGAFPDTMSADSYAGSGGHQGRRS